MKRIGGFFELALRQDGNLFHNQAMAFNSGSSALAFYLNHNSFNEIWVPYYTCSSVYEVIKNNNTKFKFYRLNERFLPDINYNAFDDNTLLIYNNYFGINNNNIKHLQKKINHLLIDASQSFFYKPLDKIDYFNSIRKFFGVPDGGFLNSNTTEDMTDSYLLLSKTPYIADHLNIRIEKGAEQAYKYYKENEEQLARNPIGKMSDFTKSLLINQDFEIVKKQRIRNFKFLNDTLLPINNLKNSLVFDVSNFSTNQIPLCYPLLTKKGEKIKNDFMNNKIFIPTYWLNIKEHFDINCKFEQGLVDNLLALPIDQRYNKADMQRILNILKQYLNE